MIWVGLLTETQPLVAVEWIVDDVLLTAYWVCTSRWHLLRVTNLTGHGLNEPTILVLRMSKSGLRNYHHQQKLTVGGCNWELWCWTMIAMVKLGCWGWLRSWLWQGSIVLTAEVKCGDSHNGTVVAVMSWLLTLVD